MKVLITHFSLNFGGGAEEVCTNIIDSLKSAGYNVTLLTIDETKWGILRERFGRLVRPNCELYFTSSNISRHLDLGRALFLLINLMFKILSLKLRKKYDLVINTYGDLDLLIPLSDISYVGFPFRASIKYSQMAPSLMFGKQAYMKAYSAISRKFNEVILKINLKPSLILANSKFTRELVKEYLGYEAEVLHPSVNIEDFLASASQKDRVNVVVTISRFAPGKHLELIPLIAKNVRANFVVIGSAPERSPLLKKLKNIGTSMQLENRLHFLPNAPKSLVHETLSRAKVYIHVMPDEPFGISIVKAMASGCVPIVHRSGGAWSDILNGKESFYGFAYDSLEQAADLINRIIDDEGLREKIASKAVERAKNFGYLTFKTKFLKYVKSRMA